MAASEYSATIQISPLYGGLPLEQQQEAIAPVPEGVRKIVLATNIAETSLTIEGIHTVVDSGLARVAVFDPATGMSRLDTRRISRSSAEQRKGRAGRLAPGHCYRMWSEQQQGQLVAQATPEILQTDLAPLALQLLAWGVDRPEDLDWLDPPPAGPHSQAIAQLVSCGAAYLGRAGNYQLTPHGVRIALMPAASQTGPYAAGWLRYTRQRDRMPVSCPAVGAQSLWHNPASTWPLQCRCFWVNYPVPGV